MVDDAPDAPIEAELPVVASPKVAIYVVAENAVHSLAKVLDRIPERVRNRVDEIFICDAGSADDTYLVGVGYKSVSGQDNLTMVRGSPDGHGANTKAAIRHCTERGYDVVALLHADGKFAPEVIESLIEPIERGEVDAVVGTRFLESGSAREMPFHKALAIRLLGALENRLLGLGLSDYHCGYQAFSVPAVAELPYEHNSDSLVFWTEILVQMKQKGLRVAEVPVPDYSGAETDGWRGIQYTLLVLRALGQYWLHSRGIRENPKYEITEKYVYRATPDASHQKIQALIDRGRQRILDVGCGAGYLAEALASRGNTVDGVDARRAPGVEARVAAFEQVDLDRDPIPTPSLPYGWVVLADVLEHLREPESLLAQCQKLLADDGRLVVSVPNVAHWSVRLSLLFGRFTYTARGILDRSHLRFYTLSSIVAELERAGFAIERIETTSPPFQDLIPGGGGSAVAKLLTRLNQLGNVVWKRLFAYQFVVRARKAPGA
jgi:SAM-dependent methyltransferase